MVGERTAKSFNAKVILDETPISLRQFDVTQHRHVDQLNTTIATIVTL